MKKENYNKYTVRQTVRSKRSQGITVRHEDRRSWIYSRMQELNIEGKSILCIGARHDSEIDFFMKKGFEVDGIDLYASGKIIKCDMSKMLEHPVIGRKRYDIVFSNESIEHCYDLSGFLEGLNVICKRYFVCMCPSQHGQSVNVDPNRWDCSIHKFMTNNSSYNENLLNTFDHFNIVSSEIHKKGNRLFFILENKNTKWPRPGESLITIETDNRIDILDFLPKNAVCAELGCCKGKFSYHILQITKPKRFFMVDPYWKAYGDMFYGKDKDGTVDFFNRAIRGIRLLDNLQVVTVAIEYDTIFLSDYPDNFFDWIYLDTTHEYEDTLKELEIMKHKVKDDGLLCGHDYASSRHPNLTVAMREWLNNNKNYGLYLIDNHLQWIIKKKI